MDELYTFFLGDLLHDDIVHRVGPTRTIGCFFRVLAGIGNKIIKTLKGTISLTGNAHILTTPLAYLLEGLYRMIRDFFRKGYS